MDQYIRYIPAWLEKLRHEEWRDRVSAASELIRCRTDSPVVIDELFRLETDPHPYVLMQALRAILHLQVPPDRAQAVIDRLRDDPDELVRLYAREAQEALLERNST